MSGQRHSSGASLSPCGEGAPSLRLRELVSQRRSSDQGGIPVPCHWEQPGQCEMPRAGDSALGVSWWAWAGLGWAGPGVGGGFLLEGRCLGGAAWGSFPWGPAALCPRLAPARLPAALCSSQPCLPAPAKPALPRPPAIPALLGRWPALPRLLRSQCRWAQGRDRGPGVAAGRGCSVLTICLRDRGCYLVAVGAENARRALPGCQVQVLLGPGGWRGQ